MGKYVRCGRKARKGIVVGLLALAVSAFASPQTRASGGQVQARFASVIAASASAASIKSTPVVDASVGGAAANWLIGQQFTSGAQAGSFPWTVGDANAAANTQGATALSLLRIYEKSHDPALLAAARANGDCQLQGATCIAGLAFGDSHHHFSGHDLLFLYELSRLSGDSSYANLVDTEFWGRLATTSYGAGANLDLAGYIGNDFSGRSGTPELVAWDLAKLAIAAHDAGRTAETASLMAAIKQSLEMGGPGSGHTTYDEIALAGAVWASAKTGIDLDPTAGGWASANSTSDLASLLAGLQIVGGANSGAFSDTSTGVAGGNSDGPNTQATAYALFALSAVNPGVYATNIANGYAYIRAQQQPGGQILSKVGSSPTDAGGVESHAESLESYAINQFSPDRYLSPSGTDAGDCTNAAARCKTMTYAMGQADPYDTIHFAPGTYVLTAPVVVNKDGLHFIADDAGNKPVITRTAKYAALPAGASSDHALLVIAGARNVRVESLQFGMDQSYVAEGIIANGFVDGLQIIGNDFEQSRSNASFNAQYKWRNAISINDDNGNTKGLGIGTGSRVTISNNVINGLFDSANGVFLRLGIDMDNGVGTISANTITTGVHDIRVRFSSAPVASPSNTTLIDGNTLNGRGLELDSPNPSAGPFTISNNHINAIAGINGSTAYAADLSIMRLIGNANGISVALTNNTFAGYQGSYRGVLIENFPGVILTGNTFAPAALAADFVSLTVSNKALNSVTSAEAPLALSVTAKGNLFNGSGTANAGRAVEFINDNDAGATFGALIFGGAGVGEANTFDGNLRWYFRLDDHSCETVNSPVCTYFLDYAGAIGANPGTNTDVRPFRGNVNALQNTFAGQFPALMSVSQRNALTARTYDKIANSLLGIVDYNATANQSVVYVASSFAGASYGDAKSFSSAAASCGNPTVYFGINAFATIPDGVMQVQSAGTVCVAKGNYAASVTIAKPLQLIGDGNGLSDTVISAPLSIIAGGSAAATPLLIQNLRVANPTAAGNGIVLSSFVAGAPIAHVNFDAVSSIGNAGYGLALDIGAPGSINAPGIDDVAISNSYFNNNGNFGLMAGRYAVVSNVAISNSTFQGNKVGGAGFFETNNAGTGQISQWTVTGSQFLSNAPDDISAGGGGLWIKTAGAGSSISGISVTGSTFADNGSGGTYNGRYMNRVGIHVRARAGTTLTGINICNNTFSETATPGTQETGIYVFDQTANTGYQPITVCSSNDFSTLAHSISGYEQSQTSGGASQPVVDITGTTIPNTEYINGLVSRIHSGTQNGLFPNITAAMNDANTVDGDEIHAPAGVYHENVIITHDGIKLSGDGASTIINGTGLSGNGIVATTRQNVTITSLAVQNFNIGSSEGACIYTAGGSNGLIVTNTVISECRGGRGGIYVNAIGDVSNVTVSGNDISNSDERGIVVWNGAKSNLTITGNTIHDLAGPGGIGSGYAGIGLQDGTASGVTISGNTMTNTGDSGIFALGMSSGTIANNQVTIAGRYGIQLLNPDGSSASAITVSGNTVNLSALPTLIDDIAGISVARRYASAGGADNPRGVNINGNTVHGWKSNAVRTGFDGFGIAVEGTAISVSGNTLDSNDIGVQLQGGNTGYPGDSNQALVTDFFSRGDAQTTCADLGANTFTTNGVDSRSVTNPSGQSVKVVARNITQGTQFCTIQGAINAASTVAVDTITVDAGTFGENVVVNKAILLKGPKATFAGNDISRDGTGEAVINPTAGRPLYVTAANAMVDGFTFDGATRAQTVVTNTAAATNLQFINNRITHVFGAAGILTATNTQNWTIARNLFKDFANDPTSPIQYGQAVKYLAANGGLIEDNVFIHVQSNALQVEQNIGSIQILRNKVDGQTAYYTNTGLQLDGNAGATVLARDNTFTNTQIGLLINNGSSTTTTVCNTVTNSQYGLLSSSFPALGSQDAGRVFDNALSGDLADVRSGWSTGALVVGSNFYDGAVPSRGGSTALIADALPATPIGSPSCGNNTPTAIVTYAGTSPQSTPVTTAFNPLRARVQDVLGGAVIGQSISLAANAAGNGATAALGTTNGTSNYNGELISTATANGLAGSYTVTATSGTLGAASFALTNLKGAGTVVFDNLSLTFTGSAQTLTAHMTPADTNVTCTLSPSTVTNAGSYSVTANCSGDNYTASGSATAIVAKATGTVTFDNLTYTGLAQTASAHITEEPLTACTLTPTIVGPDAGSYPVSASCTGTNFDASGAGVIIIAKASSVVTINPADLHQNYGSTHAVGASASPHSASGSSVTVTYDGSPTVPTATGSYAVVATLVDPNYTGSASAVLVIGDAANITLTLQSSQAMALVGTHAPYTDPVDYTGTIRNVGAPTAQKVHTVISVVRIDDGNTIGEQPIAIDAADVQACVYDPNGWAAQEPGNHNGCPQDYESLALSQGPGALNGRPAVTFRYPNLATYDQTLPVIDPATAIPASQFSFKRGDYQVHISLVGDDGTVYASAQSGTTVPDAAVAYAGATSGQAEDALLSMTTLRNDGGRVAGNVIVRVTLSDAAATNAAPIALQIGDADLAYQLGATYATLPWVGTATNGGLMTYFGPTSGFPLEDGYNATTPGRGIFHREGSYHLLYEVLDATTQAVLFASSQQTLTIGPNQVLFSLSNLHQVYDGGQHAVLVAPTGVPYTAIYELLTDPSCPVAPIGSNTTPPTNAGRYCVYVSATGTYQGSAQGTLVVAKAAAVVSLTDDDGTVDGTVHRPYTGANQVVGATATPTLGGSIEVRYNGDITAPDATGSYSVTATVVDPNYYGNATGTLVIAVDDGATIVLNDDDGSVDGTIHRAYSGSAVAAVSAITTPGGLSYSVTYVGDGSTVYPLTATPPTLVGQYHVVATTTDVNYTAVSVPGTLVIDAKASTITLDVATLTPFYDGAAHAVTATTSPAGLPYTVTYNGLLDAPSAAGSYAVVATITDPNHSATPATGTLVISAATATITLDAPTLTAIYDGQLHAVTATTGPTGLAYSVTYAGNPNPPVDAGSYAIVATITAPGHSGTVNGTLVIAQATGTVVFGSTNFTFDGAAHLTTAVIAQEPGNLTACTLTPTGEYPRINAGSTALSASCNGTNYSASGSTTLVVSPKLVTIGLSGLGSFPYDGNAHAATATVSGAVAGFPANTVVTYNGGAVTPLAVGSYEVVATLDGAATNYVATPANGTIQIGAANALVTLSNLVQAYNGTPRPVTVTTAPLGLATIVTYDGSLTAPMAVGTYTVVATIDDPNYSGSASGTLHIVNGDASAIAANGPIVFTGTAGQPVASGLPSVKVTDGGGNPVAGVTITFAAGAGDGTLSGATQTTDGNGIATLGGWTLDATAGTDTVTATAAGVTGSVTFTATSTAAAGGLSVTITDGRTFTQVGRVLTYTITVGNGTPSNAMGVAMADTLPGQLDATTAHWQCIPINGATCTASGTGDLIDTADLPAGSSVVYLLTATVVDELTGVIDNTITADAASATDTTEIVIFRDGFEVGGNGDDALPAVADATLGTLSADAPVSFDVAQGLGSLDVVTLTRAQDGAFRVEAVRIDQTIWVHVVIRVGGAEHATAWGVLTGASVTLTLAGNQLRLAGTDADLSATLGRGGLFTLLGPTLH